MTIAHMKYFITVAECKSFTQAAEQLFMTQPSLSRQIISIEKELNALLFIRHRNRSIELTPAGELLLPKFKEIYNEYMEVIKEVQNTANVINGTLKIGILEGTYVGDFMPQITGYMLDHHPNVDIQIAEYSFSRLTKKLYDGSLDAVFSLYFSIESLENLNFRMVAASVDNIAMNRSHPMAHKEQIHLTDFCNERFIVVSREDCEKSVRLIKNEFCKNEHKQPSFLYAPDVRTLNLWVECGYGVAVLDSRNALQYHPNVIFREFSSPWDPSLCISWHKDNRNEILPIFLHQLNKSVRDLHLV